jgi:hypothetical protein
MEDHEQRAIELQWLSKAKRWDANAVREQMQAISTRHTLAITGDTSDRFGTRRYPNEEARQAALSRALHADKDYQRLRQRARQIQLELTELGEELYQLRPVRHHRPDER